MEKEGQPKLKSLGGWLVIYLLLAAWWEYSGYLALKESWASYMGMGSNGALVMMLFIISLILGVVSIWLISEKKRIAVQLSILYLWSNVVAIVAVFMMIGYLGASGVDYSPFVTSVIVATAHAIIWTLYFKESKRVKETLIA